MGYKYIMFRVTNGSIERMVPVIFPDFLVHEDVSRGIRASCGRNMTPVSAGSIEGLDIHAVTGNSETLKLECHAADKTIINHSPYQHGLGYERKT